MTSKTEASSIISRNKLEVGKKNEDKDEQINQLNQIRGERCN
jgi:hypothetical protein